jgi:hypothetical protein
MLRAVGGGLGLYGLPGVALGLTVAWCSSFPQEQAAAQTGTTRPAPGASGGPARAGEAAKSQAGKAVVSSDSSGTLALVANPSGPIQWLYLIDTRKRAFAVYRIDPANPKGTVKLEAARQYRWDLELDQYNNQGLEPADVEARVKALAHANP